MGHARDPIAPPRDDSDFVPASDAPVHGMDFASEIIDFVGFELARHLRAAGIQQHAGLHASAALSLARIGALMDVLRGVERMFSTPAMAGAEAVEFVRLYGPNPPTAGEDHGC